MIQDSMQIACVILALIGTGICTITDLQNHRIYNAVTWPMILIGLLLTSFACPEELLVRAIFLVACIGISLTGVLGAGDAKLIMGNCALLGLFPAVLMTVIACVFFFLAALIRNRKAGTRALLGVKMSLLGCIDHAEARQKAGQPFAPWIFIGLVVCLVGQWILQL